jgi:hypothetical protein
MRHDQSLSSGAAARNAMFASAFSQRVAGLGDRGEPAASAPGCVLVRHHHRPAPLGAEGKALDDADADEQDRSEDAHLRVRRQEPDREGRDAHQQ